MNALPLVARELGVFERFCAGQAVPIGTKGARVETDTTQVERLGRFMIYGDAIPRILAKLRDGRTVQLMNLDNDRAAQNWLRRNMKHVHYPITNRDLGWATAWGEQEPTR